MTTFQNEHAKAEFLCACLYGDLEYVRKCIREISPASINSARDDKNYGAIHLAVSSHSIDCIRLLLAVDSIDGNIEGPLGCPLIMALTTNCSIDIIRLLIEFDPSTINMPNHKGEWPINVALYDRRSLEIVQLMVETLKRNNLPLFDNTIDLAAHSSEFEILEYLIEKTPFDEKRYRVRIPYYEYTRHTRLLRRNLLLDLLDRGNLSLDPRCEYIFVVLQKLFLKLYSGTDMSLMVNDAIIPMMLTTKTKSFRHTDWFIENVYLSATNEHRAIAARTFDLIKKMAVELDVESQKSIYRLIFPLHSLLKTVPNFTMNIYLSLVEHFSWRELHQNSITILRNDRNLFRDWYAIFNEKFKRSSLKELFQSIVELILDSSFTHSTLVEFMEIVKQYDRFGGNDFVCAFIERAKRDTRKIEDILPRFLTVYMPFTANPSADTFITFHRNNRFAAYEGLIRFSLSNLVNSTLNSDVTRYCSQQFHKDPLPLTMMCRNVIRKSVFRSVRSGDCSINAGLERLMSLPVPVQLKNFLRFNYTAYDLSTAQSEN